MKTQINTQELLDTIKDFYNMTTLKVTIYTVDHEVIVEYPIENCKFCSYLHQFEVGKKLCEKSNREAFEHIDASTKVYMYRCYLDLIEVVVPLVKHNTILGYAMFGQITNKKNKNNIKNKLESLSDTIELGKALKYLSYVQYRKESIIESAAKILEICSKYFIFGEIIDTKSSKLINKATDFIDNNLDNEFSVDKLCEHLDVSRSHLYSVFEKELNVGVSSYVKERKIKKAILLLKDGSKSIKEIAYNCGFNDETIFIKTFKKYTKMTPGLYRKSN